MEKIIRNIFILLLTGVIILCIFACTNNRNKTEQSKETKNQTNSNPTYEYTQITPQEAKSLMDSEKDYVILDVREQSEFDEGHIENAILIPYTEIENRAESELPDKNELILVYCRSGRRSKIAAQALADMGYSNVKEFGGIIDWPYGTVK